MNDVLVAAIHLAKARGSVEAAPDHLLEAALLSISRFGIVRLGELRIDLEALEIEWLNPVQTPPSDSPKTSYSDSAVTLLDRAARIAKLDGAAKPALVHLLAAFRFDEEVPLLARIAQQGVSGESWRAALTQLDGESTGAPALAISNASETLSPEQAAALLGVHHQTIRGYIRSGKLPAFRLAGERAVRIRRADLEQLFEPVTGPADHSPENT